MPQNCAVFPLLCELTRSAIYGSQTFDSHQWPTVLVNEVKRKPCNFECYLCGSSYSTFKISLQSYAFYNKRLQSLFKDQLDQSKETCSFKSRFTHTIVQQEHFFCFNIFKITAKIKTINLKKFMCNQTNKEI